jgi:hypothetical protein
MHAVQQRSGSTWPEVKRHEPETEDVQYNTYKVIMYTILYLVNAVCIYVISPWA